MRGIATGRALTLVLVTVCLALLAPALFAAGTGQIKGTVRDKDTKEALPGASVIIKGTTMGAMTDPDGNFTISRVEPGTYTLVVSSVSYQKMEIVDVKVQADLTTQQLIAVPKAVTELDKTITVTAKTEIIDKFVTSNQATITQQEIKTRPVQTVDNLLKQVAGVQTDASGKVYIRGGRAGEVSYIVDGVPIGDPLGGGGIGANLSLVSGSIQEIQIIKDGFDPEYGNALSGIVKVTTQTGSKDNTRVNMQYLTDDLGNASLNKYSRNYDYARFSVSGPDPILKSRILPALGLNFLADKEFTYYLYFEMDKDDGIYQYESYDTPITERNLGYYSLLGIDVPERLRNRYYWTANVKFRPKPSLNVILSYKNSDYRGKYFTVDQWEYRYSPNTAPLFWDKWYSLSAEVSQSINKNTNYEMVVSYYDKKFTRKPADPNHPGVGLDPDQFTFDYEWESYTDRNNNGVYDAPEPLINLFPDSAVYGTDFNGPAYTFGEFQTEENIQGGTGEGTRFRFNNNGYLDSLEGEPFIDINGNGVWDQGDFLQDKNGNGVLDGNRISLINNKNPEPYIDGDSIIGEPFTDINQNGIYDRGIDIFTRSSNPAVNQDYNYNGVHDGPDSDWEPGIPYEDRNGNGIYDRPNSQYDVGERFTDINGNGKYDYGGTSTFLDPGSYDEEARWTRSHTSTTRGEIKIFRLQGPHELKVGAAVNRETFTYEDILRPYLTYTGRPDNAAYPDRGAFRDFFSYNPWSGTVYFRDKIEYGSMIASLGLRFDFFLQDTKQLIDVATNDDLGSGIILGDRHKWSPRIGFSYPISDKAKVHFNYGHFFQLPEYSRMYARNTASVDQNSIVGNYNLDYQKTIQYSFGVKYAMTENYSVDFSGYFKDEFDKINSAQVRVGGLTRQQYRNSDYGRSRGVEVTLEKRGGGYVNGQLSYTYAFAFGKASQTNENYLSEFLLSRTPLSEAALDNDIRHSLKAAIQIYIPNTVKPRLFGLPISNGWSLSVESVIESGRPFTPTTAYPNISTETGEDIETNSLRLPATAVFDVRFQKGFKLVGLDYSFIVWVENLFNSRNVASVYTSTGRADTQQNFNRVVFGGTDYDQNPYNWGYGRQVRLGIDVNL
ncbi:MAG: TonB-dependent receptor [Candidatus Zixiibacteriota bacterium]